MPRLTNGELLVPLIADRCPWRPLHTQRVCYSIVWRALG